MLRDRKSSATNQSALGKKTLFCQLEIDHVTQKPKETCQSTCRGPRFKAIETKSVSDADCMKLLTPGPEILMERFRDVACQYTKETINKVTFLFLKTIEFYFSVKSCVKKK